MEMLLAALLVLMIPGLLTYLVPEREPETRRSRNGARLARALLRRLSFTAPELEAAARALPGAVPPFHRCAATKAAFDDRRGEGFFAHLWSVEKGPDGPYEAERAPSGAPGIGV